LIGVSEQAIKAARPFVCLLRRRNLLAKAYTTKLNADLRNECKSKNLDYKKIVEELLLMEVRKLESPEKAKVELAARELLRDTELVDYIHAAIEKSEEKQF